jgi:biopolymer transport protein TolQ
LEPAAITPESFTFVALFARADWVVKSVMILLGLASLASWGVILDKAIRLRKLNRAADAFEAEAASGRSLEDIALEAGENPPHALHRMLKAALFEWREARSRGPVSEAQAAFLVQRIDRVLDASIARESLRVETGLSALAIVATASPFVGLFGTVWGIMHSFQAIAVQKNTSLAVVAPSIAEALFATAIGLIAALPAYIAFNHVSSEVSRYAARLEGFADDLSTAVQRRLASKV